MRIEQQTEMERDGWRAERERRARFDRAWNQLDAKLGILDSLFALRVTPISDLTSGPLLQLQPVEDKRGATS
jgi:hypothetical protein